MFKFNFFEKQGQPDDENRKEINTLESGPEHRRENRPERTPKEDTRLNEGEALTYQTYATNLDATDFSERASDEAYAEAEELLNMLKKEQFNFLGINWDKIDLNDAVSQETVRERLLATIDTLSTSQGKDIPDAVMHGGTGKNYLIILASAVLGLMASTVPETAEAAPPTYYSTSAVDKDLKGPEPMIFSPHWDTVFEQGNIKWGNALKVLLEPLALNGVFRTNEEQKIEINVPYEYARLFNSAKPLDPADLEKMRAYIEQEFIKQVSENVYAFGWDKEALDRNNPDALKLKDITIKNIHVGGSASPEGRTKESHLSGNIDSENEDLATLRATHAKSAFEEVLKEQGIPFDQKDFAVDGVEEQLTIAEEKAIEALADKYNIDPFELIKQYNAGAITDVEDRKILDEMFASKRKVMITFESEGEAPKGVIIPLPLLLLFLLRRRGRGAGGQNGGPNPAAFWNIPLPRFRVQLHDFPWRIPLPNFQTRGVPVNVPVPEFQAQNIPIAVPVPSPHINWKDFMVNVPWPKFERRDVVIERFDWRELEDDQLEKIKLDVFCDIAQNNDLYEGIARRYVDVDLSNEEESVGRLSSHILTMWEDMDNQKLQQSGVQKTVEYFGDNHQRFYAELHGVIVRRITIDMQYGKFLSQKIAERRQQIEKMIEDEFERYRK